jgi:hypothetical protein
VCELLTIEAVDALVGAEPEKPVGVLRDAGDREVAQAVGRGKHAERQPAGRHIVVGVGLAGERGSCQGCDREDRSRAGRRSRHGTSTRPGASIL